MSNAKYVNIIKVTSVHFIKVASDFKSMKAILKHVGTADWDKEDIEYVNSQLVCASSEDAAMDAVSAGSLLRLTCLNVLLTSATEKESPQSLVMGRSGGTVLSSKRAKKVFIIWKQDVGARDVAGFPFVVRLKKLKKIFHLYLPR